MYPSMLQPCHWCAGVLPRGQEQVITWQVSAARREYAQVCPRCYARWLEDGVIRERVEA